MYKAKDRRFPTGISLPQGDYSDVVCLSFLFHLIVPIFILVPGYGNGRVQAPIKEGHPNPQHSFLTYSPHLHLISEVLNM